MDRSLSAVMAGRFCHVNLWNIVLFLLYFGLLRIIISIGGGIDINIWRGSASRNRLLYSWQ